jgi:chemotaxis protein CheD
VGIGELAVSGAGEGVIVTHSLGSCVAVVIRDARTHVGGLLHFQLPESRLNPDRALSQPGLFADSGIERLMARVVALGGLPKRSSIYLVGGRQMLAEAHSSQVGKRNALAARKVLWHLGLPIQAEHVGGTISRTVRLHLSSGIVEVFLGNKEVVTL